MKTQRAGRKTSTSPAHVRLEDRRAGAPSQQELPGDALLPLMVFGFLAGGALCSGLLYGAMRFAVWLYG